MLTTNPCRRPRFAMENTRPPFIWHGDRVGAIIVDGTEAPRIFALRTREAGVLPILEALVAMQPRAPDISPRANCSRARAHAYWSSKISPRAYTWTN